jgi:hypothetical protein
MVENPSQQLFQLLGQMLDPKLQASIFDLVDERKVRTVD